MKSILQNKKECFICEKDDDTLSEHHFIEGATNGNRENSEKYGLKAWICYDCHSDIHLHPKKYLWLKQLAQQKFEEQFGDRQDFIRIFGKSYL